MVKPMNLRVLYQWTAVVSNRFRDLSKPQKKMLAIVSICVVRALHCHQRKIASFMPGNTKLASKEARLQRFVANERLSPTLFFADWVSWCVGQFDERQRITLIVDETTIGRQYRAMVIALAYRKRAITLIWRCYRAQSKEGYPAEGQTQMIIDMLHQLAQWLPADREIVLQADRGIGNSPTLCKAIASMGWYFCFRMLCTAKVQTAFDKVTPIELAKPGKRLKLSGKVFVRRGKVPADVRICWDKMHPEPWIIATNLPRMNPKDYMKRSWIEQSFRDLKSGGWHLSACRLRTPQRVERFMMALAMAMALTIELGRYARDVAKTARNRICGKDGKPRWILSVFKEGLRYFQDEVASNGKLPDTHYFMPRRA